MNFSDLLTPVGILAICLWIIYQLLDRFVFSKGSPSLREKVYKLETNHIAHLQSDIVEIKDAIKGIQGEQIVQGNRITRLETIVVDKVK